MPLQEFGRYGTVGFELVASIGVGFFVGRAIDAHFGTHGVATWIGFFFGVLSGFLLLVRTARTLEKESAKDDASESAAHGAPLDEGERLKRKLENVEADIAGDEEKKS
jgi:F0F1-type ATP synthase assembly protein I